MFDSILDAIFDTLKALPILYLVYLLVGYFAHNQNHKFSKFLNKNKNLAPFVGAFVGCIPQCGFSSVMADMYSKRKITLGTMIAVFIATSDEAIPIMISNPSYILTTLKLILIKFSFALFFGFTIDLICEIFSKNNDKNTFSNETIDKNEKEHHHDGEHCCVDNIFKDALIHTLTIAIYIFVATYLLNVIVNYLSVDFLIKIITNNVYIQILVCSLIGLIPNCAASVFLVELYMYGGLFFPAMIAGLCSGSGVGLIILYARNKNHKFQNFAITLLLYAMGVISGLLVSLF